MARILITNGTVVTMDSRRRIIKDGAVAIENDKIVDVGKAAALKDYQADKVFDAANRIIMPGLVDAHIHNVQMLSRGIGDDVDLIAWCYDRIYPYEVILNRSDEYTYLSAMLCCAEMIRTGTTCGADPGGYKMENVARAFAESGFRGIVSWSGMDRWSNDRPLPDGLLGKIDTDATMREEEKLIRDWHGKENGRIRASYALRVEPNVSDDLYRRVKAAAERDSVIVQYHAAVNKDQVDWVRKKTGQTTIAYMNKIGVLKSNWLLTHMAVLTDEETHMLKDNDTKLCHNPGATLHGAYGAVSVGKFPEMLEMGITIGMGCDSSAANNSLDMFRTMYQVATSHKEFRLIPDLIAPEKALEMATVDGARAIAWDKEIGSLERGKKADVIIVDTHRSNWIPIHDFSIIPNLVYSGEGADVETSIIDGRVVMENRKILTMDVESVLKRAQAAAVDVISQLPYKIQPRWPIE